MELSIDLYMSKDTKLCKDTLVSCNDDCTNCANRVYEQLLKVQEEKKSLEYTLMGVMHSVDKWLEGEELDADEVNRAATMREKVLKIIEGLQSDNSLLQKSYDDMHKDLVFRTEQVENLQSDSLIEDAAKLIGTMKNNKKAALWLRKYEGGKRDD